MRDPPPPLDPDTARPPASRVDLFEQATRVDSLEQAWHRVRTNGGCAGSDGMTIDRYRSGYPGRLFRLHRNLRDGSYEPAPLRIFEVPKGDGGMRPLAVPTVADRIAQTAVAQTLTPVLDPEFSEVSFAYRPGRSVQQAVQTIVRYRDQGFSWVVESDIERYFERVPHRRLLDRLEKALASSRGAEALVDLVALWLEAWGRDLGSPDLGLAQGSPLSPLLSNLYLDAVDDSFVAEGAGLRLVRFADDFVILARREAHAEAALARMQGLLEAQGLAMKTEKTRLVSFERGFRFLGHLFVRSIVMKSAFKEEADRAADGIDELLRWVAARDADEAALEAKRAAERTAGLAATLRALYILEPGRVLGVRNQAFTVEEQGLEHRQELIAIPAQRVDRIELGPEATVEDAALRLALASDTILHWVDGHGATQGILASPAVARAGLHEDQARLVLDPERRAELARRIVEGRIKNQRALLHRLNRGRSLAALTAPLAGLNKLVRKLPIAADVPEMLGHEGAAAALYWPALAALVQPDWAVRHRRKFKRERHPAADAFNIVLNYLAHLLARDLSALVLRHGLHPGFGALHSARDDAEAVVYDLMEEFRAPLTEGLAVYLLNNQMLTEAMFTTGPEGAPRLGREGHGPIIRGWEAWLDRPIVSPRTKERTLWRGLMEDQVCGYAAHCAGKETYRPYVMDY